MSSGRTAIVVVHGMGNQTPLSTIREFVEKFGKSDGILYSSPDRVTGDYENRRFSYRNKEVDYFEYYWAHLMQEPTFYDVIVWSIKLFFFKRPSQRAKRLIYIMRVVLPTFILILLGIGIYLNDSIIHFFDKTSTLIAGVALFIIYKLTFPFIKTFFSNSILQSIGDVVKYTVPSPQNIEVRNKIRAKGIDMLKKLHEAKGDDGKLKYQNIVIIGHSLGSIVAYDMMTFLFHHCHNEVIYKEMPKQENTFDEAEDDCIEDPPIDEKKFPDDAKELTEEAKVILGFSKKLYKNKCFDMEKFQETQHDIQIHYRRFEMPWRIPQFITLGSPLTHASMILAKDNEEFEKRKQIREYPECPPVTDKNDLFKCFFEGNEKVWIPHHGAMFAMTKWTNIYFKNDYIGGDLHTEFGRGIKDIPIQAEKSCFRRLIPFASHTSYWDKNETNSIGHLRELM